METNNNIQEAIKMIESHDWNWRYADYGYDSRFNAAKASMKNFVKFVKTIENNRIRETLRNMWMLVYHSKMEEYSVCKNELLGAHSA